MAWSNLASSKSCGLHGYILDRISSGLGYRYLQKSAFSPDGKLTAYFSIPLVSQFIPAKWAHAAIHAVFGDGLSNSNSWLGNQCIFSFRHRDAS